MVGVLFSQKSNPFSEELDIFYIREPCYPEGIPSRTPQVSLKRLLKELFFRWEPVTPSLVHLAFPTLESECSVKKLHVLDKVNPHPFSPVLCVVFRTPSNSRGSFFFLLSS